MGGGLLQLIAYGSQDVYLTGNPQITFFKVVYRRHTNFSMECIKQDINGHTEIGIGSINNKATVTISKTGDLLTSIYIKADQNTDTGICGDHLIEDVSIEIGGQRIDKHYREWNQIWNELTIPKSKQEAFKYLTGAFNNNNIPQTTQQTIMYPLNFWFCRNPGLALPLIALQYHDIQLKITWGTSDYSSSKKEYLTRKKSSATSSIPLEVWGDYIYLDTDERRRFAQVSHEYLIEQLQLQSEGSSRETYKLNFDHPIKELIWTVPTSTTEANTILSQKIKLELNGHDRFAFQDREYFQLKHPLMYHTSIPGYNIKESETPTLLDTPICLTNDGNAQDLGNPSPDTSIPGQTGNVPYACRPGESTVDDKGELYLKNTILKIGRNPSSTLVHDVQVGDLLKISVNLIDQNEEMTDAILEANAYTKTYQLINSHSVNAIVTKVERAVPPEADDYTRLTLSPDTGIMANTGGETTAKHCATVSVVARTVNPISRCSQLKRDIFVYSFALNPEEHQPSGTCNFSKIESAKLLLRSPNLYLSINME